MKQVIKDEIKPIKNEVASIKDETKTINQKLDKMDTKINRIETRVNATFEQTATLTEFRAEANEKLDNIRSDVSLANMLAAKNRYDIEDFKQKS